MARLQAALALLLAMVAACSAFYLPGVAPQDFKKASAPGTRSRGWKPGPPGCLTPDLVGRAPARSCGTAPWRARRGARRVDA